MNREPANAGLEFDVLYGRQKYCYLKNNSKLKRYAKRSMNKRFRKRYKKIILAQLLIEN